MSLHHTQKTKYQKLKDSGMTAEELKKEMLDNKLAEADVDQFIAEVYAAKPGDNGGENTPPAAAVSTPPVSQPPVTGETPASPTPTPPAGTNSASIPVFNYKALTGDEWERYEGHVKSLDLYSLRDFQQFKAEQVTKERYPGLPGTPVDIAGIRIINDTPINTTRISIAHANEMNKQLPNSKRIYLLKQ